MSDVAAGYDQVAAIYEELLVPADWMRRRLREQALAIWQPGDRLLDVGGGVGSDAVFFAERGLHATLIDVAPAMVAAARRRSERHGVAAQVDVQLLDYSMLGGWAGERRFDGVISWFAALNSAPDLRPFATAVAQLLPAGGRMLLHMLNARPLWRSLTLQRERGAARRAVTIGDQQVEHTFYRPRQLYQTTFAAEFELRAIYGMALLRPPTAMPARLAALDLWLGRRRPLAGRGDFFVLDLQRR